MDDQVVLQEADFTNPSQLESTPRKLLVGGLSMCGSFQHLQKSFPEPYLGTIFHLVFIYKCSFQEKQVIKEEMGVGRAYREPYVGCMCLAFVLNQREPETLASLVLIILCLRCSFIHSFTLLFVIDFPAWLSHCVNY